MPADQLNWNYYTYVSDDGTTYNLRANEQWVAAVATGLAAATVGAPRYISSSQKAPRHVIYRDSTTFRTRSGPIGTAAAFAALNLGATANFAVPGLATTVAYTLVKKVGEKVPVTVVGRQDTDHA